MKPRTETTQAESKHMLRATDAQQALLRARAQSAQGSLLERVAQEAGVSAEALAEAAPPLLGISCCDREDIAVMTPTFDVLAYIDCLKHQLILVRQDSGQGVAWLLCIDDPWQTELIASVSRKLGAVPEVRWGQSVDIAWALQRHAEGVQAITAFARVDRDTEEEQTPEISLESIERISNPVVRFVDAAILDAWKSGASDIHVESSRSAIVLKYRLDGVLVEVGRFDDARRIEEVLNRVKVIAGLDISERRVPQDGRFRARLKDRHVDFRVSIMPSIHGEDAVIRLLDKSHLQQAQSVITLEGLGFAPDVRDEIRTLASEPHGMLLVTGPTGSGKTTTLYAVLSETRSGLEKIITIEDPVEYELPGVLQIPVNEKKGLSFSRGLRSILRHDPDRLLVGEIRDPETAEIAVQAALTGHGVLTTVHANNGFDAVNRFVHMGVDLYAFTAAINGIVSQRLMRRVCESCATSRSLSESFKKKADEVGLSSDNTTPRIGSGCVHCRMTGYRGRFAVSEVLRADDEFRQLIVARAPVPNLKRYVAQQQTRSLRVSAIQSVLDGHTTEEEFHRVVAAH